MKNTNKNQQNYLRGKPLGYFYCDYGWWKLTIFVKMHKHSQRFLVILRKNRCCILRY